MGNVADGGVSPNKLAIKGVVMCPCGGQIISNSGKCMMSMRATMLHCWTCQKGYAAADAYAAREDGKTVTLDAVPAWIPSKNRLDLEALDRAYNTLGKPQRESVRLEKQRMVQQFYPDLSAELKAARKVVEAARRVREKYDGEGADNAVDAMADALDAYDGEG